MKGWLIALAGLVVFGLGIWQLDDRLSLGIGLLIVGLLVFVVALASSLPQSTDLARDE